MSARTKKKLRLCQCFHNKPPFSRL